MSPLFLLGNILDHRVRGARLSAEQHATARKFALELGVNEAYATYLAKDPPFTKDLFENNTTRPYRW